jgi:hypothetical protein
VATAEINPTNNVHRIEYDAGPETRGIPQQMFSFDDALADYERTPECHQVATGSP